MAVTIIDKLEIQNNTTLPIATATRIEVDVTAFAGNLSSADNTVQKALDTIDNLSLGGSYTDENAQDAIGTILTDSSSIDFTYSDATPSITAVVLPAGVDHNSLLNFDANKHIDHTGVSISAGTGLSGGGTIAANRTLNLADTAVTPATYGSTTAVGSFTVDQQGRLTGASSITITPSNIGAQPVDTTLTALAAYNTNGLLTQTSADTFTGRTITAGTGISVSNGDGVSGNPTISTSITQYTDEMAQDAVGGALTDSSSIDFTYTDGTNTITAVVLPAGVDHNSLSNFDANKHIDHTGVSISAGTGLTGGGTIASSRTLTLADTAVTPATYGSTTAVGSFTVDQQGRITAASSITITPSNIGAQPVDTTLTALSAYNTNGILTQTAADTFTGRTITAGTGISVSNGDGVSGNPTISTTITQYTDENAQDAIGTILVDSATIDFTYSDATPSITADIINSSVTYAKIQNVSATDKILGRSTVGAGVVEEITCTSFARSILDDAAASDVRTTLGLGTAATSNTTAFEAAGSIATHAALTASVHGISAFGATLVDDANAAAACTTLGLGTGNSPTFTGLTLSGLTLGSVPFASTAGLISQDNTNFFWDATNKRLGIGLTPVGTLTLKSTATTEITLVKRLIASQTAAMLSWQNSSGTEIGDMPVTGQIRLPSGSASAPTFTFYGDQNTGIYWDGSTADTLFFTTGGVARGAIDSNGDWHVGATAIAATSTGGHFDVSFATPTTGTPDPTTIAIRTLSTGSWTAGQPWGRLDFINNDTSGGSDATDKCHGRIEMQVSAASGGASELVFYVKPSSLVEAFRFTKDLYLQIGGSRSAAALAIQSSGAASALVYGTQLVTASADAININQMGFLGTWSRTSGSSTITATVYSTAHLTTGDSIYVSLSSDNDAFASSAAYTITVVSGTTYTFTGNNAGRLSGTLRLSHNWTRSGSTATFTVSSTTNLNTGMKFFTTNSSSTGAIANFTDYEITVTSGTQFTITCTAGGATAGYVDLLFSKFRMNQLGDCIFGHLASGAPAARVQIKSDLTTKKLLILDAIASQTADLMQVRDSSANVLALIDASGRMQTRLGTTTATSVKVPGTTYQNTTQTGNTAATETDCFSHSVAANTLATNGDALEFYACGTIAATASTDKRIKVKFGSTTIFDSGTMAIITAQSWSLRGMIIRTGATTQKCSVSFSTSSTTLFKPDGYSTAAETLSGAVTLKLTIQGTNASDVVGEFFKEVWLSAT